MSKRSGTFEASEGGNLVHDGACASGLAHNGDSVLVAAEFVDMFLNPDQREALIPESGVGSSIGLEIGASEEAKGTKAVIQGHEDDSLVAGQLACCEKSSGIDTGFSTVGVATSVDRVRVSLAISIARVLLTHTSTGSPLPPSGDASSLKAFVGAMTSRNKQSSLVRGSIEGSADGFFDAAWSAANAAVKLNASP